MNHERLGPIPVGTMVMIVGTSNNAGAVGTVVGGEELRCGVLYDGSRDIGLKYKIELARNVKLSDAQLKQFGHGHRYIVAPRACLLPLQDPGDTEEIFRESDTPRRRTRSHS